MLPCSKTLHIAVRLQHRDVYSQHMGSGLKVEVGCCLSAGIKQPHDGHEISLPAAHAISPRERQEIA